MKTKKILAIGIIAMLVCGAGLAAVSAGNIKDQTTKENINDGESQTVNIVLRPQEDGSILTERIDISEISVPEGVEIQESWKNIEVEEQEPSEEDWAFVRSAMTDLSEEERDRLISEAKKIWEGNSTLSEKEQNEILQKLGHYIVKATEGDGGAPLWCGYPDHWHMSTKIGEIWGWVTPEHNSTLGDYCAWADDNRDQPDELVPWWGQNRHSWVVEEGDIPFPGFDNFGPASLQYYLDEAGACFVYNDVNAAYIEIGKALHYIEDLGCPFHTSSVTEQEHHEDYEMWAANHWDLLDSALDVDVYYVIDDPEEDSKLLVEFSNQFLHPIAHIMENDPDWENNATLVDYTRTLLAETEKMTLGMFKWTVIYKSFEPPVPIYDYETSYVHIDDVPCSDSMLLPIRIDHTYIGDLEIWIGWAEEQPGEYTEQKIWDREGGGADHLAINVWANGFENVHHWRLRVYDAAAGDEGEVTEFSILIG